MAHLEEIYAAYLDCLNRQDWERLGEFVGDEVEHNGRKLGLSGYREMLVNDYRAIPDLRFNPVLVVCNGSNLAARLRFDCSPRADFLGLPINGKRVKFSEHAFYEFEGVKISRVWSVDKSEIELQPGILTDDLRAPE